MLSITGSKLYFILAGYSVQLLLPVLLGSPEAFGLYASAMSLVSIINNVLIVATIQTVSHQVSATEATGTPPLRQALFIQSCLGGLLAGCLFGSAPLLASHVLLDPLLTPLLRTASIVVLCYAIYAALIGYLNGQQAFQRQATLDLTYTTLRTAGILGAAALGYGVHGSITGFALAAVLVLFLAFVMIGRGAPHMQVPYQRWLGFMAPVFFYHLCLNLSLQLDLTLLKRSVADLAQASDYTPAAAAELASRYAGFYRGAQTFSFVPYQLILSVAFVVFPMISHATSMGDSATARSYIRNTLRFSMLVLCAIAAPVSGASGGVLRIAYPEAYLAAADALSILAPGMACFALFVVSATILTGAGLPLVAAGIALLSVLCVVTCNLTFVYANGLNDQVMWAAASGTCVGTCVALGLAGAVVYRRFGAFLNPLSSARILVAASVGFFVARNTPHATLVGALLALVAGGLAYLVALALVRELGQEDLQAVRAIIAKRSR